MLLKNNYILTCIHELCVPPPLGARVSCPPGGQEAATPSASRMPALPEGERIRCFCPSWALAKSKPSYNALYCRDISWGYLRTRSLFSVCLASLAL